MLVCQLTINLHLNKYILNFDKNELALLLGE